MVDKKKGSTTELLEQACEARRKSRTKALKKTLGKGENSAEFNRIDFSG